MKLPIYQLDAFADRQFQGNPAAVVPLDAWLADEVMQSIAMENNLAETAFFVPTDSGFSIRWFTPTSEVDLCGHATLAAAFVLMEYRGYEGSQIKFDSRSGELAVTPVGSLLELDFPSQVPAAVAAPAALLEGLKLREDQCSCLAHGDYLVEVADSRSLRAIEPDFEKLEKLDLRGVIVTSAADDSEDLDFYSRFFAPKIGVPEDPVTGSAYTQLTPYWAERLGKSSLEAMQLSSRGGKVSCKLLGARVRIAGSVVPYLAGTIQIDQS